MPYRTLQESLKA